MANIGEAVKKAGAANDLPTILQVLEGETVGFKRQEAAAGPFATVDIAMLSGLTVRMRSVIKKAQQQQGDPGRLSASILLHCVHTCSVSRVTLCLALQSI